MLLDLAAQLGGEFIHADAYQAGTLAQRPGVAGMEAQLFGNLESANQAGREPRRRFALCGLQHGLQDNLFAAVEVVDQQERYEGQENQ